MQTFDNIFSRRSIRSYTDQEVTASELQQILKAGYAAPIGRKLYDTLHMTVITNRNYLDRWETACQKLQNSPDAHPFYGAPVVVLVSSVVNADPFANVNYSNAACVVENMALAAVELGIGSCHIWGAVRELNKSPELLAELNIPEGMIPCCAIILGHTEEKYTLREIAENRINTTYFK